MQCAPAVVRLPDPTPPRPLPRRCNEAVLVFSRLPPEHYQTGWVAVQVGRAFYEMVDYPAAENAFLLARQIDPYRLKASGSASLCRCRAAPGPAQLSLP
jgi:anaphase-promoting complex subunit 3